MEAILGVIVGFIAFGVIWFFLLRQKNNQISTDELKLKEEELKKSEIKKPVASFIAGASAPAGARAPDAPAAPIIIALVKLLISVNVIY